MDFPPNPPSNPPPDDEPEPFTLRRRTLEEQVEYLIFQFGIVYAQNQKLIRDVESLQARLAAVERTIPWQAPPKQSPPPLTYRNYKRRPF